MKINVTYFIYFDCYNLAITTHAEKASLKFIFSFVSTFIPLKRRLIFSKKFFRQILAVVFYKLCFVY